jgi:hypothetical protein
MFRKFRFTFSNLAGCIREREIEKKTFSIVSEELLISVTDARFRRSFFRFDPAVVPDTKIDLFLNFKLIIQQMST